MNASSRPAVRRVAWLLAIAGALVFAALAALLLSDETRIRIPAIAAMVTYSAVILSFLGGIEWGLALREDTAAETRSERLRAATLAWSALPSLAAWGVLWLPSTQWQLAASLALFVAVWLADLWLARQGLVPAWFVDLRTAVTALVALILGASLFLL